MKSLFRRINITNIKKSSNPLISIAYCKVGEFTVLPLFLAPIAKSQVPKTTSGLIIHYKDSRNLFKTITLTVTLHDSEGIQIKISHVEPSPEEFEA